MTLNPSPCILFQRESFLFFLLKSIQWVGHNLIFGPLEKCFFQGTQGLLKSLLTSDETWFIQMYLPPLPQPWP